MGSFGERMKRERELRAIALDDIANSTKIGTRLLHALEEEQFDKLPGGIFNKGFVRAYAKYLGIDEEQAVADYLAAENEQDRRRRGLLEPGESRNESTGPAQLVAIQGGSRPDNVYNIRASVQVVENPPDPAGGFLMAAVILVFVLGLGGFGYKYFSSHSLSKAAAANPESKPLVLQQTSSPQAADQAANQQTPTTSPQPSSGSPQTGNVADASAANSVSSESNTAAPKLSKTDTSAVPTEMLLHLRAEEESWAQVTADGKTLFSGVIAKDSAKEFRALKEMVVKLGNAPGVQLSYNGKALHRLTGDSKTRILTFRGGDSKPE
jgi:cytoskeleton protein RodZ